MNQQYAGAGARFLASLIDGLLLGVVSVLIVIPFALQGKNSNSSLIQGLSLLINLGYFVYFQGRTGQTLGKKVMGIKVVDVNGNKPSYFTFFLRELIGKAISSLIFGIGYLMILWDKQKQGLHDKIATTYVVKVSSTAPNPVQPQPVTPVK